MKSTMDFNNKTMQAATVAVMNDILASDVTGSSMEDAYKTVCKYANLTKAQFEDAYKQAEEKLSSWKNNGYLNGSNCELIEDDLDMVVGGSVGSFFRSITDGVLSAVCAAGNFVKEHAVEIAIVAGCAVLFGALGAGIGVAAGCLCVANTTSAVIVSTAVTAGEVAGGVAGGVCGGFVGWLKVAD